MKTLFCITIEASRLPSLSSALLTFNQQLKETTDLRLRPTSDGRWKKFRWKVKRKSRICAFQSNDYWFGCVILLESLFLFWRDGNVNSLMTSPTSQTSNSPSHSRPIVAASKLISSSSSSSICPIQSYQFFYLNFSVHLSADQSDKKYEEINGLEAFSFLPLRPNDDLHKKVFEKSFLSSQKKYNYNFWWSISSSRSK